MKRLYGLLALTAFLMPQTTHSLNRSQLQKLQTQFQSTTRATACDAYNQLSDAGYLETLPSDMLAEFRTQFGNSASVLCPPMRGGTAPIIAPTGLTLAALNAKITGYNLKVQTQFGVAPLIVNLNRAKAKQPNAVRILQEAFVITNDAQTLIAAGEDATKITPIFILSTKNPLSATATDYGPTFILGDIATTQAAVGTLATPLYPTIYVNSIGFDVPTPPVRPGPKTPTTLTAASTTNEILAALVDQYSVRVNKLFADRATAGKVNEGKAKQGDKKALLALANYAEILNDKISKIGISTGYITVISTTQTLVGATGAEKLQKNIDQLNSAFNRLGMSTLPKLYTVIVAVDNPSAYAVMPAPVASARFVKDLVDQFNDLIISTFGLPNNLSVGQIAGTQYLDVALTVCNNLAFDLMKNGIALVNPARHILVGTTNNLDQAALDAVPATPSARTAFIASQNAAIRKAFAGVATPPVYFVQLPATGNPIAAALTAAPVAPAPIAPTLMNRINTHNAAATDFFTKNGKVKAASAGKKAVLDFNTAAETLMTDALADMTIANGTRITILSTNNAQAGIDADYTDPAYNAVTIITTQKDQTDTQLANGVGYFFNTNHQLYKLEIPLKR